MRTRSRATTVATAVALAACTTPSPADTLCAATIELTQDIRNDRELTAETIATYARAAEELQDLQELRDPASRAAQAMAAEPERALDPLREVFDRCVELDLVEPAVDPFT